MTDKSQQRERFEAEWVQHNTAIEPHEMIRYGMVKAIAFRYWQAALSQSAAAGAVDEWKYCPECGNEEWMRGIWDEGNHEQVCTKCGQSWFADIDYTGVIRQHLSARTASPSQPAAEGDEAARVLGDAKDAMQADANSAHALHPRASAQAALRASPADDGGKMWSTNDITDADMRSAEGGLGTKP